MNDTTALALLPAGLHDLLPPDAEREAALVERAMAVFRAHGYERVKPPLVEFEESLLSGVGRTWALQTFRLMDPESQRMMAVRADMTLQVARIAASRLVKAPRPLRLCYSGEVLRVGGEQLRPERQFRQIGCELIGALEPAADAEIVLLAGDALSRMGVRGLSIDLNLPTILPTIFAAFGISGAEEKRLTAALAHRDAVVAGAVPTVGPLFAALLAVAGPADAAIKKLGKIELPAAAEATRDRLVETVHLIRAADPNLTLTVDPLERQGFEYQSGLSFTIFARGARRELGRGGRYRIGVDTFHPVHGVQGEPAVGFSLFADEILAAAPAEPSARRVFLPVGTSTRVGDSLRESGWVTIAGLAQVQDERAEARRLACGYILVAGATAPVSVG